MGQVAHIWRHPIKGIGSEALDQAQVSPEGALHGDRAWALLNSDAPNQDTWQPRRNFLQVASGPGLATIEARSDGPTITLTHPEAQPLTLLPEADGPALATWVTPFWPEDRPAPGRLVRAPGHGMTDMPDPWISLGNLASLKALSQRAGQDLDMRRFRINLWLDGLSAWEEQDWQGSITLGAMTFDIMEPIGRCRAPEANPATGRRDANTNNLLEAAGQNTDFGIYLRARSAGTLRVGDTLERP